jgi:hypothetical protein
MTVPPMEGSEDRIVTQVAPGAARGVVVTRPRGGGLPVRMQGAPAARPWEATGSIEVEALAVWAYRDQRVGQGGTSGLYAVEVAAMGYEPRGRSADGCAVLADIAHMGCRVQGSGVSISSCVHPVAEAVDAALVGVDGGRLVAHYAREAGRPGGWALPARRYRPVMWVEPGVDAQWEHTDSGHRYCPIITAGSPDDVARSRVAYGVWWDALDRLAWTLSMRALGFVVMRPVAPCEPWLSSEAA